MRIVFTHTDFPLYWPKRLASLHQYLAERDANLHVVELAGKGSPYAFAPRDNVASGIPWTCLFPETRMEDVQPAVAVNALTACLDRLKPDLLIAGALAFPSGIGALHWAKRHGRPIVLFDSVRLEDVPRGPLVSHIKRRFYRHADAAFSAAPGHERPFIEWGLRSNGVFHGLEVVDNEHFAGIAAATLAQADTFRRELALAPHFFLGVGRFVAKKNWHALLRAYASFRSHNPASDWHLVIVGDGEEHSSLQELAAKAGIGNMVSFTGFASQETLARIYALAGALVLPSRYGETWGLVVNEAMACSLPVLVSEQCGCAATLVKSGENGWTFSPDDTEGLAGLLSRMATMPDPDRTRMGERSSQIISDWGMERFCEGVWQAIQFALANPLPPPSLLDRLLMSLWKGRYRPT